MSSRVGFSGVVAILTGLTVLAGYFLNIPLLTSAREVLLHWALILFSVALLAGVMNLVSVHWLKMTTLPGGKGVYSFILLLAFVATLLIGIFWGPTSTPALWIFNSLQIPVETSLMALLAVLLISALVRLIGKRLSAFTALFLVAVLVSLLANSNVPGIELDWLRDVRGWINEVWVLGGARGLLLGVALGTIAVGLRVLMGGDPSL